MRLIDEIKEAVKSALAGQQTDNGGLLQSLQIELGRIQADLTTATAALTAATAEATAAKTALTAETAKVTALEQSLASVTAEKQALQATIDNPDGEIEKRAGLKAGEIAAQVGAQPINIKPAANPANPAPATAGLKGHARFAAASKVQLDRDFPMGRN